MMKRRLLGALLGASAITLCALEPALAAPITYQAPDTVNQTPVSVANPLPVNAYDATMVATLNSLALSGALQTTPYDSVQFSTQVGVGNLVANTCTAAAGPPVNFACTNGQAVTFDSANFPKVGVTSTGTFTTGSVTLACGNVIGTYNSSVQTQTLTATNTTWNFTVGPGRYCVMTAVLGSGSITLYPLLRAF